jgi:hypothetical protein
MSANDYALRIFTCPICRVKSNGLCLKPACIAAIKAQQEPDEPEKQEPEPRKPIDGRIIALDETEFYHLPDEHKPYIKAIRGVYLYDANSHAYCCELTPSYWLIHLYNSVLLTEEGLALDDDARGEIYDEYEYDTGGDDCYMHVATIDRLEKAANAGLGDYYAYGATEVSYEDSDYDEQIEGLREHFCCNPPF